MACCVRLSFSEAEPDSKEFASDAYKRKCSQQQLMEMSNSTIPVYASLGAKAPKKLPKYPQKMEALPRG
jgi:hypothetical protein